MEIGDNFTGRFRKVVPVCNRKDPVCMNNIYFSNSKAVTFGRMQSEEVQIKLMSKHTPLMISRKHATISPSVNSYGKDCFAICDHNSQNGVYINGRRLKPNSQHELKYGDKVAFGCGLNSQPAEFEYIFERVVAKAGKRNEQQPAHNNLSPTKRQRVVESKCEKPSNSKSDLNATQIKEQNEKISRLSNELQLKEAKQKELMNMLQETEEGLMEKLEKEKTAIEKTYMEAEAELKRLLEKQLLETKAELKSEYEIQVESIKNEKSKIEKTLTEEFSHKLSETEQQHKEDLLRQKEALENAMQEKESQLLERLEAQQNVIEQYKTVEENQKELETCLIELRKEIQDKESQLRKQEETVKKVENEAKQNVIQTMEDEFSCIICQELFVDSTTLPCAHTFCELCLKLWMRKKKNCPVCRRTIKGKAVRSVVLDSAVEKMIQTMEPSEQERRFQLLKERAVQKQKEESSEDPTNIRSLFYRPEDDDDSNVEGENLNESRNQYRPRDNHRRRSRSRSPRHFHHRQRPYDVHRRHHQHEQGPSSAPYNSNNELRQFYNNQHNQQQRYIQVNNERNSYVPYYHGNNNIRCFRCGGFDHIARFCHRQ